MCSRPVGRMPLTTRLPRAPSARGFFFDSEPVVNRSPWKFGVRRSRRRFYAVMSARPRLPFDSPAELTPLKREQDSRTPKRHRLKPVLLKQVARDDLALDLAGAFVDRDDAGVAVHALDVGLARIADAAVNLHRFIDYAIHHFAGVEFGLRRRRAQLARMRVLQPRGVVHQAARRFDFRLHIRQHPLNGLKLADSFPKRAALLGVLHGFFQRALRQSHGQRADANAPAVQRTERNLQSLPFFAEAIFRRHFAIVQHDLHRGRRKLPHFFFVASDAETLEARFGQKSRNSFPARFGIGLRENNEDAGNAAVVHPGLRAIQLRYFFFCASLPKPSSGTCTAEFVTPSEVAIAASTRATSSSMSTYEMVSRPAPPHCSGVVMPQQPSSAIFLTSSVGKRPARSRWRTPGRTSFSMNWRTVSRISFCWSLSEKSMQLMYARYVRC